MDKVQIVVEELIKLLKGGGAHATLDAALANLPADAWSVIPDGLPYSIWQLVEHIRIAQWDMLEFSKDGRHQSPKWPDDYWPKETAPKDEATCAASINQIKTDLVEFMELLTSRDIYQKILHGDGQNILREALQIADHNAYHIAEIIVIRRLLKNWNSPQTA